MDVHPPGSSFLISKRLLDFETIRTPLKSKTEGLAHSKKLNSCDCKVSSIVLSFLGILALGVGAYLASTGGPAYFAHGGTQNLAIMSSGIALGSLGIGFAVWTVFIVCLSKKKMRELDHQEAQVLSATIEASELLALLEDAEPAKIESTFVVLNQQNIFHAFLEHVQKIYFPLNDFELSENQQKVLKAINAMFLKGDSYLPSNMELNSKFARKILNSLPVLDLVEGYSLENGRNEEIEFFVFVKKLFRTIGKIEDEQVLADYKRHSKALVDVYVPDSVCEVLAEGELLVEEEINDYVARILVLMNASEKKNFIVRLDQKKNEEQFRGYFNKHFTRAVLTAILELNLEPSYPLLIDKLFTGLKPDDEESKALYAKFPEKVISSFVGTTLTQEQASEIFDLMDNPQKVRFVNRLSQHQGVIATLDRLFVSKILDVLSSLDHSNYVQLIDALFTKFGIPQTDLEKALYAKFPEKVVSSLGNKTLNQDQASEIFDLMDNLQKVRFVNHLNQHQDVIAVLNRPLISKVLGVLSELNHIDYITLIDILFTHLGKPQTDQDKVLYAKFPTRVASYTINKIFSQENAMSIFDIMQPAQKNSFLEALASDCSEASLSPFEYDEDFAVKMLQYVGVQNLESNLNSLVGALFAIDGTLKSELYAFYPERLAEKVKEAQVEEKFVIASVSNMKEDLKVRFLVKLREQFEILVEGDQEAHKKADSVSLAAFRCIESILTDEFALQENFPDSLLTQVAGWPSAVAHVAVISKKYTQFKYSKILTALWEKMNPDAQNIFVEHCLKYGKNNTESHQDVLTNLVPNVLDNYGSNPLPTPLKQIFVTMPEQLATIALNKKMNFESLTNSNLGILFNEMKQEGQVVFLKSEHETNLSLFKERVLALEIEAKSDAERLNTLPLIQFFIKRPELIKDFIINNDGLLKPGRYALALNIFELMGNNAASLITDLDKYKFGYDRFTAMLKILVEEANTSENVSKPRKLLASFFLNAPQYSKVKSGLSLDFTKFETLIQKNT